jgi:hypothetical protein
MLYSISCQLNIERWEARKSIARDKDVSEKQGRKSVSVGNENSDGPKEAKREDGSRGSTPIAMKIRIAMDRR